MATLLHYLLLWQQHGLRLVAFYSLCSTAKCICHLWTISLSEIEVHRWPMANSMSDSRPVLPAIWDMYCILHTHYRRYCTLYRIGFNTEGDSNAACSVYLYARPPFRNLTRADRSDHSMLEVLPLLHSQDKHEKYSLQRPNQVLDVK